MTPAAGGIVVVIAAYNAEASLNSALASVAGQTLRPAEVVVADDCSTDETDAVARRWSDLLPLTVVRTDVNSGPSAARNLAVKVSTSPLIAMLDADDVWLPDHLEVLNAEHHRTGGPVASDMLRWAPGEGVSRRTGSEVIRVPPPEDQLAEIYADNFIFTGCLFTRTSFERAGGFRVQFFCGEDWDLWIRMLRNGDRFTVPDHPTVLYRVSSGSITASDRSVDDILAVLETAAAEATDPVERRAIRHAVRRARAQVRLFRAYALARDGRGLQARLVGLGALGGTRRVALRGFGMTLAPRRVAGLRAEQRSDLGARLTP